MVYSTLISHRVIRYWIFFTMDIKTYPLPYSFITRPSAELPNPDNPTAPLFQPSNPLGLETGGGVLGLCYSRFSPGPSVLWSPDGGQPRPLVNPALAQTQWALAPCQGGGGWIHTRSPPAMTVFPHSTKHPPSLAHTPSLGEFWPLTSRPLQYQVPSATTRVNKIPQYSFACVFLNAAMHHFLDTQGSVC